MTTMPTINDLLSKSFSFFYNCKVLSLFFIQILNICLYAQFTDYGSDVDGITNNNTSISNSIDKYYPFYQDVHVMILVGFGFLMTFLKKYSHSALGYNFFLSAICIQSSILINGFFHCLFKNEWHKILLDIQSLIKGDFAAAAILISFGALLGKTTLNQMVFLAIFELIFYAINESIGVVVYKAVDMGGSMYVHTFGAYFGLAASYMMTDRVKMESSKIKIANYNSDIFAMIGTLFLWIYWPSFNGALATGNAQHRVVVNTVLSLSNSCLTAFIFSKLIRPKYKFNMVDIQNATLAGGVAVGSSADLVIAPSGALLIGMISGLVSVLGFVYIQPKLESMGITDTCGIHNLHGLPGVIGGLSGFISSSLTSDDLYGNSIEDVFPARDTRTAIQQGLYQLAALGTTLGISIIGGLISGFIIRKKTNRNYFDDHENWDEEEEDQAII